MDSLVVVTCALTSGKRQRPPRNRAPKRNLNVPQRLGGLGSRGY